MIVALRADASAAIGFGHLVRCLALGHALRALGARVAVVVRELGADAVGRVRDAGFDAIRLPAPEAPAPDGPRPPYSAWAGVREDEDAAQTAAALAELPFGRARRVVVDHYAFGAAWHRAVADALDAPVAAIDDLADRPMAVDVLVDPNRSEAPAAKWAACLGAGTELLAGPSHALLGPAYARAPRWRPRDAVRSVGVFLGGTDPGDHAPGVLRALDAAGFDGEIEVVATRAYPRLEALRSAVAARPRTTLSIDLPDLAAFFARHDLQVGAGGGATWERCCIGAPTLAIAVADNQRRVLDPLAGPRVIRVADAATPDAIARGLRPLLDDPALRAALSAAATRLVDGGGAARVAHRLLRP